MQKIKDFTIKSTFKLINKIKNYIIKLNKSRLIQDLSIVFSENIITKGLNFAVIIFLTRYLGSSDYGKYSFIFIIMALISSTSDLGMENTAVRFSNKVKKVKNSIFGLYLITKISILTLLMFVILFFGKTIFILINKQALISYIPFLSIGILGESLFLLNDTYLQSIQMFKLRAIINISRYLLSLSFVGILIFNQVLLLKYVFYIYFIPLILSLVFLPKYISFLKAFYKEKLEKKLFKEICNYQKWMINLSFAHNILTRIDFIMLSFWVSYSQLGFYNAAIQLASIVSFLPYVLGKVILPKISELQNVEIFKKTRQIIKPTFAIFALILCLLPLVDFAVPLILGQEYVPSIAILKIFLVAFGISFITVPLEQAFYSMGKPSYISKGRYAQILTIILVNIYTIPKYGIIAAAYSVLFTKVLFLVFIALMFIKKEKNSKKNFGIVYRESLQ